MIFDAAYRDYLNFKYEHLPIKYAMHLKFQIKLIKMKEEFYVFPIIKITMKGKINLIVPKCRFFFI